MDRFYYQLLYVDLIYQNVWGRNAAINVRRVAEASHHMFALYNSLESVLGPFHSRFNGDFNQLETFFKSS